jgi:hypothetical protein
MRRITRRPAKAYSDKSVALPPAKSPIPYFRAAIISLFPNRRNHSQEQRKEA